ncbi:E3 ubiquitin-protein ligase [Salix suchowensis]|nr:E3 ubiquitin-protein ligase [Salix suchowensis]
MATSLEELLAMEGFRGGRSGTRARPAFKGEPASVPPYPSGDRGKKDSPSGPSISRIKTERTRSDVSQLYFETGMIWLEETKIDSRLKTELRCRGSKDLQEDKTLNSDTVEDVKGSGIVEVGAEDGKFKDIYSDKAYYSERKGRSSKGNGKSEPAAPEIALDEAAVKAVTSILNGYIKRFFRDSEFRTTLRHNCLSSLSMAKANLEQAIATVEKVSEAAARANDLKTAALQLSVITGLNSNDRKDDYTPGTPNSRLSACAHIYLSVVYKLQKKDKASAKHLLQVFCDSPFPARNTFVTRADALFRKPSKITRLKFLDKVYSETLDSCTCQFAVYYKDWLTEGVEAPSIPSVDIPFTSQQSGSQDHSSGPASPSAPFSPQPTVSKKLYDAVFGRSSKPRVHEAEGNGKAEKLNNGAHSSGSSPIEIKHTVTISFNMATFPGQDIENHSLENVPDNTSIPDKGLLTASNSDLNDDICNSSAMQESEGDNAHMLKSSSHTKANELALKTLAKSVFELQRTEDSGDPTVSELSNSKKATNVDASTEGPNGSRENFDEGSVFDSIPHDFICPLTGELFEDPVTLETGRTFEREAIREWFDLGNRTCPVTGKTLACSAVPLTNSILKLVIDGWKMVKE